MKVLLKRGLFLGGVRYRQDSLDGVEIPDDVDGKPVVLFKDWRKGDDTQIPLPRDAELFAGPVAPAHDELLHNTKVKPKTLRAMIPKAEVPFALAPKDEEED